MKTKKLPIDKDVLKKKLTGLLYRKKNIENHLARMQRGATIYNELIGKITEKQETLDVGSYEHLRLSVECMVLEEKAQGFITTFKETKREYNYYLIPQIEDVTEALDYDKESIEFKDIDKEAEELVKTELYGATQQMPANVEHPEIISKYERFIAILEKLLDKLHDKAEQEKDPLEKLRIEREMFVTNLQLENIEKRLKKRIAYYHGTFLPSYKKDMDEADKYLGKYLKRAKQIAATGMDPKLAKLLIEYEQNKDDESKRWLLYTTLRARIDDFIATLGKKKIHEIKDYLHLIRPIRETEEKQKSS